MRFIKPENLNENSIILDVRNPIQYNEEHLALPHILIEAKDINPKDFMQKYNPSVDKTINILCTSGGLSSEVAQKFEEAGFDNIAVIIGGIIEAEYEGMEIIKNTSHNSLPN